MLNRIPDKRAERGLDRLRADLGITNQPVVSFRDEQDAKGAAIISRLKSVTLEAMLKNQRREEAPHGRCGLCNEPLTYEPDSIESHEYMGARGNHVVRGGHGCPECCIPIQADQIVRVA